MPAPTAGSLEQSSAACCCIHRHRCRSHRDSLFRHRRSRIGRDSGPRLMQRKRPAKAVAPPEARRKGSNLPVCRSLPLLGGGLSRVCDGLAQVLDLLAQNLDLPLDKLGLHPDDFIDILGLNDLLGEVER